MIRVKALGKDGNVTKLSFPVDENGINVDIDNIVVIRSSFGLDFGVVTDLNTTAKKSLGKVLCVVPDDEDVFI